MTELISILVPIYGVEKYIERCSRSLFGQTYFNIEYIFVDDCTQIVFTIGYYSIVCK